MKLRVPSAARLVASTLVASAWLCSAPPAAASPDTFRSSLDNIVGAPLDLGLSPITAAMATSKNVSDLSDSGMERASYALPGYLGLLALQIGWSGLRGATGIVQLLPGVVLFPFDTDLPESMNFFRRGNALVDWENPLAERPPWLKHVPPLTPLTIDLKFGITPPVALYSSEDRTPD